MMRKISYIIAQISAFPLMDEFHVAYILDSISGEVLSQNKNIFTHKTNAAS